MFRFNRAIAASILLLAVGMLPASGQDVTPGNSIPGVHPGYASGAFYAPYGYAAPTASPVAITANLIGCVPGSIAAGPKPGVTLSNLLIAVTTTDNGQNFQLAVYSTGSWGRPERLLVSTSNIALGAGVGQYSGAAAVTLPAGPYWFCLNTSSATAVFRSVSAATTSYGASMVGATTNANASGSGTTSTGVSIAQAFGTWPSAFTSSTSWTLPSTAIMPWVYFQVQ